MLLALSDNETVVMVEIFGPIFFFLTKIRVSNKSHCMSVFNGQFESFTESYSSFKVCKAGYMLYT